MDTGKDSEDHQKLQYAYGQNITNWGDLVHQISYEKCHFQILHNDYYFWKNAGAQIEILKLMIAKELLYA